MKIEIGDPIVNVLVKMVLDQFKQFDRERNFDDKYNELLENNLDFALEYEELLEHTVFGYVLDIIGVPENESYPHLFPKEDDLFFDDDDHPHFHSDFQEFDFEPPAGFCRDWFYDKLHNIEQKPENEREGFAKMTISEIIETRDVVEKDIKEREEHYKEEINYEN